MRSCDGEYAFIMSNVLGIWIFGLLLEREKELAVESLSAFGSWWHRIYLMKFLTLRSDSEHVDEFRKLVPSF